MNIYIKTLKNYARNIYKCKNDTLDYEKIILFEYNSNKIFKTNTYYKVLNLFSNIVNFDFYYVFIFYLMKSIDFDNNIFLIDNYFEEIKNLIEEENNNLKIDIINKTLNILNEIEHIFNDIISSNIIPNIQKKSLESSNIFNIIKMSFPSENNDLNLGNFEYLIENEEKLYNLKNLIINLNKYWDKDIKKSSDNFIKNYSISTLKKFRKTLEKSIEKTLENIKNIEFFSYESLLVFIHIQNLFYNVLKECFYILAFNYNIKNYFLEQSEKIKTDIDTADNNLYDIRENINIGLYKDFYFRLKKLLTDINECNNIEYEPKNLADDKNIKDEFNILNKFLLRPISKNLTTIKNINREAKRNFYNVYNYYISIISELPETEFKNIGKSLSQHIQNNLEYYKKNLYLNEDKSLNNKFIKNQSLEFNNAILANISDFSNLIYNKNTNTNYNFNNFEEYYESYIFNDTPVLYNEMFELSKFFPFNSTYTENLLYNELKNRFNVKKFEANYEKEVNPLPMFRA